VNKAITFVLGIFQERFGVADKVCTACGYVGEAERITKGSFIIEVFLWLMLLVPGVIYTLWRHTSKYEACPECQSPGMIPEDSPVAQKFLADLHRESGEGL
jgi:hypothetical protein